MIYNLEVLLKNLNYVFTVFVLLSNNKPKSYGILQVVIFFWLFFNFPHWHILSRVLVLQLKIVMKPLFGPILPTLNVKKRRY